MFKTYISTLSNRRNEYKGWYIETVHTPSCGSYYCLAVGDDGVDVGETRVFADRDDAIKEIKQLIDNDEIPMY